MLIFPTKETVINEMVNNPANYVAIYARESNSGAKGALDSQVFACKEYALDKKFLIYNVYKEFISATQARYNQRSEFRKLLQDVEFGFFKKVIVTRRDRIARRFEEFIEIKSIFKDLGIEIIYCKDVQLPDSGDYSSSFIENMIMAVAELEPQNIRERTETGRLTKEQAGIYFGSAPFEYKKRTENDNTESKYEYIKDGQKAVLIKNIFNVITASKIKITPQIMLDCLKSSVKNEGVDNEYKKAVSKLTTKSVTEYISRPVYAALRRKSPEFVYKDFRLLHEGKLLDIEEQYFDSYTNVEPIIGRKEWFAAIKCWLKYNTNDKDLENSKRKRNDSKLYNNKFICDKCNKPLVVINSYITCASKECSVDGKRLISKEKREFLKEILRNYLRVWKKIRFIK